MKSKKHLWALLSLSCLVLYTLTAIASDGPLTGDNAAMGPAELVSLLLGYLPAKVQTALVGYLAIVGLFRHAGKLFTTIFHKYCEMTETKVDDEFLARVENSASWRVALFWIDLLLSWKPYRGPSEPVNPADPPTIVNLPRPSAPTIPHSAGMIAIGLLGISLLTGCINLAPTVRELAKDNAAVSVEIDSIYVRAKLQRSGGTNAVSISHDGIERK
jgi:hypothetical protein